MFWTGFLADRTISPGNGGGAYTQILLKKLLNLVLSKPVEHRFHHFDVPFRVLDAGIKLEADEQDKAVEVQP